MILASSMDTALAAATELVECPSGGQGKPPANMYILDDSDDVDLEGFKEQFEQVKKYHEAIVNTYGNNIVHAGIMTLKQAKPIQQLKAATTDMFKWDQIREKTKFRGDHSLQHILAGIKDLAQNVLSIFPKQPEKTIEVRTPLRECVDLLKKMHETHTVNCILVTGALLENVKDCQATDTVQNNNMCNVYAFNSKVNIQVLYVPIDLTEWEKLVVWEQEYKTVKGQGQEQGQTFLQSIKPKADLALQAIQRTLGVLFFFIKADSIAFYVPPQRDPQVDRLQRLANVSNCHKYNVTAGIENAGVIGTYNGDDKSCPYLIASPFLKNNSPSLAQTTVRCEPVKKVSSCTLADYKKELEKMKDDREKKIKEDTLLHGTRVIRQDSSDGPIFTLSCKDSFTLTPEAVAAQPVQAQCTDSDTVNIPTPELQLCSPVCDFDKALEDKQKDKALRTNRKTRHWRTNRNRVAGRPSGRKSS
jgi:hypothetical protein